MAQDSLGALVVGFGGLEFSKRKGQAKEIEPQDELKEVRAEIYQELDRDQNENIWVQQPAEGPPSDVRDEIIKRLASLHDTKLEGDLMPEGSDSFSKLWGAFAPVVVTLTLPRALQKIARAFEVGSMVQISETFHIVFDGQIVVYAAEVDPNKWFDNLVFADVCDRFVELLRPVLNVKIVAPNVTRGKIFLYHQKVARFDELSFLQVPEKIRWPNALLVAYLSFKGGLDLLFSGGKLRLRALVTGSDIARKESGLLRTLGSLLATRWYQLRFRAKLVDSLRRDEVDTLRLLSKYLEIRRQTRYLTERIRDMINEDENFSGFMKIQSWKTDVEEEVPVDVSNVTRTIEHVRSESQVSLGTSNNYIAALIGALAGGLVSVIVSQLPSIVAFFASIHFL